MTIATLFFIFLALTVLSVIFVAYNFIRMFKDGVKGIRGGDTDNMLGNFGKGMTSHVIGGLIGGLSGLGAIITGVIWLVRCFSG